MCNWPTNVGQLYYFRNFIYQHRYHMQMLQKLDYVVFFIYFLIVAFYGWWIYNRKKAKQTSSKDYFLAEGSLTWWAIGASLIASNISAEQMSGISGIGFRLRVGISTYDCRPAGTVLIDAVFFIAFHIRDKM